MPGKTEILIVEDQRLVGDLLQRICEIELCLQVLRAETGGQALETVRAVSPALLLLDIGLPDMDGVTVAKTVLTERPRTRILVLSGLRDPYTIARLDRLPIQGFVDKQLQDIAGLARAIRAVVNGGTCFTEVYTEVLDRLRADPLAFNKTMTEYEQRILSLVGRGLSDATIAAELGLSAATMQSRRRDLLRKLNLHSTRELMAYAVKNGFVLAHELGA